MVSDVQDFLIGVSWCLLLVFLGRFQLLFAIPEDAVFIYDHWCFFLQIGSGAMGKRRLWGFSIYDVHGELVLEVRELSAFEVCAFLALHVLERRPLNLSRCFDRIQV